MIGLIDFIFHLFLPCETSEMFRHFVLITKTTQPRLLSLFSFNCSIIWQFYCKIDVSFSHITNFFQFKR